ncbi:phage tail protein [Aliarcobacter butzleri]|uniref:phage tail protein n=1 Tax=Aliarcobacter butzleri TaxID=28197 RepID=UPI0021B59BF0|nr:phage tail protein [Aliarcobacter butzleri]MCT7650932.1 phage tail protein [Aliarcobacter butzleri]
MENFYTLLSNTGINAIIAARASNSEVKLTKIAVGDGDIIPSQDMTSLKSEKHRFNINSIIQDIDNPNYLIVEGVIPSNVGGFYVSEVAIYTDQNTLFAIGSLPKTYKPLLEEGSAKDLTIKIFLEVTNADSVTLKVDDSVVLATRKFVLSELKKYALINGDETKKFKVADAVELNEAINKKQFDDNAVKLSGNQTIAGVKTFSSTIAGSINGNSATATKLATARTIGGVSFDGSANINLPGVNTAGNQNTTGNAATVTNGVYTTGNQTIGGVKTFSSSPIVPTPTSSDNSTKVATTAFVKSAINSSGSFTQLFGSNGWTKLPNDLIIQWGSFSYTFSFGTVVVNTFPIAFTTACYSVSTQGTVRSGAESNSGWVTSKSTTSFSFADWTSNTIYWIAIGK